MSVQPASRGPGHTSSFRRSRGEIERPGGRGLGCVKESTPQQRLQDRCLPVDVDDQTISSADATTTMPGRSDPRVGGGPGAANPRPHQDLGLQPPDPPARAPAARPPPPGSVRHGLVFDIEQAATAPRSAPQRSRRAGTRAAAATQRRRPTGRPRQRAWPPERRAAALLTFRPRRSPAARPRGAVLAPQPVTSRGARASAGRPGSRSTRRPWATGDSGP